MNDHDKAVMAVLRGGGTFTVGELFDATGLTAPYLDAALYRLTGRGCVRKLNGGRYKAMDHKHSAAVKRGLFIKGIPQLALLCGIGVQVVYPVVTKLEGMVWWTL